MPFYIHVLACICLYFILPTYSIFIYILCFGWIDFMVYSFCTLAYIPFTLHATCYLTLYFENFSHKLRICMHFTHTHCPSTHFLTDTLHLLHFCFGKFSRFLLLPALCRISVRTHFICLPAVPPTPPTSTTVAGSGFSFPFALRRACHSQWYIPGIPTDTLPSTSFLPAVVTTGPVFL